MAKNHQPMKILIFGAGVLGSLVAARLQRAGNDVTLAARGQRYRDLCDHGIVIEDALSGKRSTTPLRVVAGMPLDEYFDLCLVVVQKTQLADALPVLAGNPHIPTFLFLGNNPEGPGELTAALGAERVLIGFLVAGGERDGYVVRCIFSEKPRLTFGSPRGAADSCLADLVKVFRSAGISVGVCANMEAWLRYHVALVGPLANALYLEGGCNYRLARSRETVRKSIRAIREGMQALRRLGYPVEPATLWLVLVVPDFILTPLAQRLLNTRLMEYGAARHANAARCEVNMLNEELLALVRQAGIPARNMEELHRRQLAQG